MGDPYANRPTLREMLLACDGTHDVVSWPDSVCERSRQVASGVNILIDPRQTGSVDDDARESGQMQLR